VAVAGAVAAVLAVLFAGVRRLVVRPRQVARAEIGNLEDHTTMDPRTGAVRSIQAADVTLPEHDLEQIWTPEHLERLAATYWRFLSRATAHVITVRYHEGGRQVVAFRVVPLLTFKVPEYEMDGTRGIVRWRIDRGFLVSKAGRGGDGYLEIDVQRCPSEEPGRGRIHVEIEVANFYPAIASALSRWVYTNTQSRIHVIVTYRFLRSLARLDLAESKVGRFVPRPEDVPDPQGPTPTERQSAAA
jgi:hypothetical protein